MDESLFVNQYGVGEWHNSPTENSIIIGDGLEDLPKNDESEQKTESQADSASDTDYPEPRPADQRAEEFLSDWLRRMRRSS